MKNRFLTDKLCLVAFCIAINVVCPFIAMNLRLPIYMDSIGTILVTRLFGPVYGIMAGVCGSLLCGITFDVYSLYYFPVQILTSLMTYYACKNGWLEGKKTLLAGIMISLPTAIVSAVITAFVFGGITAAGSSYIVVLLNNLGVGLTASCFIVQVLTEYCDKTLAALVTGKVIERGHLGDRYGTIQ